jgi:hypothetical protein
MSAESTLTAIELIVSNFRRAVVDKPRHTADYQKLRSEAIAAIRALPALPRFSEADAVKWLEPKR